MTRATTSTSDNFQPRLPCAVLAWVYAPDAEPSVNARMLRDLAVWYRALAARAGNPVIWEARLLTAYDLDAEASRIDPQQAGYRTEVQPEGDIRRPPS